MDVQPKSCDWERPAPFGKELLLLQLFRCLGRSRFFLGDSKKNRCFYMVLASTEGSGTGKVAFWKSFNIDALGYRQHSPNIGPKMGQHGANIGQHRANIGPRQGQDGVHIGQHRANLGQHRANIGQHRANMGQDGAHIGQHKANIEPT